MSFYSYKLSSYKPSIRIGLFCALLVTEFSILSAPAPAQDLGIELFSDKLAGIIGKAPANASGSRTVVVMDFVEFGGHATPLSIWLTDQVAETLSKGTGGFHIFDRKKLRSAMEEQGETSSALQGAEGAASFASALQADLILLGSLSMEPRKNRLSVEVIGVVNGKKIGSADLSMPSFQDFKDRMEGSSPPQEYASSGKNGVGYPSCANCLAPQYSERAQSKNIQGSVILQVVITAEGRIEQISVLKSLNADLDGKAIEAVRQWRFYPAKTRNGIPVAIKTDLEVVFRPR